MHSTLNLVLVAFMGMNAACGSADRKARPATTAGGAEAAVVVTKRGSGDGSLGMCDTGDFSGVNYTEHIRPIFESACASCHGAVSPVGSLDLSSYDAVTLSPSSPLSKLTVIVERIQDGSMPPSKTHFDECSKSTVLAWVELGAPRDQQPPKEQPKLCSGDEPSGKSPIRRLWKSALAQTFRDTFLVDQATVESALIGFPDHSTRGFRTEGPAVEARYVDAVVDFARTMATHLAQNPSRLMQLSPCLAELIPQSDRPACFRSLSEALRGKFLRQEATDQDIATLVSLYSLGSEDGHRRGIEYVMFGILMNPAALLLDIGSDVKDAVVELDGYEIAAKIAYAVTGTAPDDALLNDASTGSLKDPKTRAAHVRRLAHASEGQVGLRNFFKEWFGIRDRGALTYTPAFAAGISTSSFGVGAVAEAESFFDYLIAEKKGHAELYMDRYVDPRSSAIAAVYDIEVGTRQLDEAKYAGILTRVATTHATGDQYSLIKRGVSVLERSLCEEFPPLPPEISGMVNVAASTQINGVSHKQKADALTAAPACAGCHAKINPVGAVFGNYDSLGRFVGEEVHYVGGQVVYREAVDAMASMTVTGKDETFDGAVEFSRGIADSSKAQHCSAEHLLAFSLGRATDQQDFCLVDRPYSVLERGGSWIEALESIVTSAEFVIRRI